MNSASILAEMGIKQNQKMYAGVLCQIIFYSSEIGGIFLRDY